MKYLLKHLFRPILTIVVVFMFLFLNIYYILGYCLWNFKLVSFKQIKDFNETWELDEKGERKYYRNFLFSFFDYKPYYKYLEL
jgi:hypothetical protein